MLWVIAVILLNLWLLGITTGYTLSGIIYILPVISFMALITGIITDRRFR